MSLKQYYQITILFLIMTIPKFASTQTRVNYHNNLIKAIEYNNLKDYQNAAIFYFEIYSSTKNIEIKNVTYEAGYNAACSWALNYNFDKAFNLLDTLITYPDFIPFYEDLINNTDFTNLYYDSRWKKICNNFHVNKIKFESNLDKCLVGILDSIYENDQNLRLQLQSIEKEYGSNSEQSKTIWKNIHERDSNNLVLIKKILDKHGWLGSYKIGFKGNQTLFLVIQHSDLETQNYYFPMMENAAKEGTLLPCNLALLKDKMALNERKKQIYGSQIWNDINSGILSVYPIMDPDNVDNLRAEVGLAPLSQYLLMFNLNWNLNTYKDSLPMLEKRLHIK